MHLHFQIVPPRRRKRKKRGMQRPVCSHLRVLVDLGKAKGRKHLACIDSYIPAQDVSRFIAQCRSNLEEVCGVSNDVDHLIKQIKERLAVSSLTMSPASLSE